MGVPVIGFCHTDLGALAALHIGEWAEKPVRRHWGEIYRRFDRAVAPSRYIAGRLADAGVDDPVALPLGVDVETFRPDGADPAGLRRRLGLSSQDRLLVFAGRPAREKRVDVLIDAVERLGEPYRLLLVGARAATTPAPDCVIELPYEKDPARLAALIASCDAFVHANDSEPFGLIVLEAMACGLPVVGVAAGGVGESVDREVGELAVRSAGPEFAEAIEALFDRDLDAVGCAARQRACERHGWDAVFLELSRIYAEVSGEPAFARPSPAYALAS
jgi:alpha-1,6-mannosyltransferase